MGFKLGTDKRLEIDPVTAPIAVPYHPLEVKPLVRVLGSGQGPVNVAVKDSDSVLVGILPALSDLALYGFLAILESVSKKFGKHTICHRLNLPNCAGAIKPPLPKPKQEKRLLPSNC